MKDNIKRMFNNTSPEQDLEMLSKRLMANLDDKEVEVFISFFNSAWQERQARSRFPPQ